MELNEFASTAEEKDRARFWGYVVKGDGCWEWRNRLSRRYGRFAIGRRSAAAHRLSYVWAYGAFDEILLVCHRCDNPRCVRPDHLFLGTNADNMHDMKAKGRARGPKRGVRFCNSGHEFTPENTYIYPKSGNRACRECTRRWQREKRQRRAA
jgi:hypothetical protein